MINNRAETLVKDGNVYIKMEDLLDGLYAVCNKWAALHTGPNETEAAQRLIGMVDLCQGLDDLHQMMRRREGLT